jgi:thiol-disulfide isomerase/thioredoxin
VVEYYADWCGHCQQFAPGYEKAANNLHGIVKFGAVNADKAKATTAAAGVRGFPTVKLYVPGTGSNNPYTKKWFKPPLDYEGARSAKPLVAFATGALPNQVVAVNDATLAAFKSNNTLPRAVLFTKKEETSPLLKALSVALSGRMLIGEARDTSAAAVAEFGVADFPTVFTLDTENGPPIVYGAGHSFQACRHAHVGWAHTCRAAGAPDLRCRAVISQVRGRAEARGTHHIPRVARQSAHRLRRRDGGQGQVWRQALESGRL